MFFKCVDRFDIGSMGWVTVFRLTDVDEIIELGREVHYSLPEDHTVVGGYTGQALESYNQLDPAPAINHDTKDGCPLFVEYLRHFVGGAEFSYGLDSSYWSTWLGTSVSEILSDDPEGKQLWEKLGGGQSEPYSLTVEGVEYQFVSGQFLFGLEIQRFGESLDAHKGALIEACPENDIVDHSTIENHTRLSGEEFLSEFITHCLEAGETTLLWRW